MIEVDSLVGNEFKVTVNGEKALGLFRVEGFTTFKIDVNTGERLHLPFRVCKMVQRDGNNPFNTWLRETTAPNSLKPERTLVISAIDDGVETRRWTVKGAWIAEVSYATFDTASAEMVEEIITVHYESVEESWPATPNLT